MHCDPIQERWMKTAIGVLGMMGMLVLGTGCSGVGGDVSNVADTSGGSASDVSVQGAPDGDREAGQDVLDAAVDSADDVASEGAGQEDVRVRSALGFPRDDTRSTGECPQIVLPLLESELGGTRPSCAFASPVFEHVVDIAGTGVDPDVLKGQPTVLWFFPAPLTPG